MTQFPLAAFHRDRLGGYSFSAYLFGAVAAVVLLIWPQAAMLHAQPLPQSETLLLVQFDGVVQADFAVGEPMPDSRLASSRFVEGRFGAALDFHSGDWIAFSADGGNFNPAEGTLEFWVKPHWPGNDPQSHRFATFHVDAKHYININVLPGGRLGIAVAGGEGSQWRWRRADADIARWKPDQWHHVAFTWGKGQLRVFVDGRESSPGVDDAAILDRLPERLYFAGADAVIGGLRLSRRALSARQVRESIAQALDPPYRYVSDLPWQSATESQRNRLLLLGNVPVPLILGSRSYAKGIAMGCTGQMTLERPGGYDVLEALVGVSSLCRRGICCTFEVWGDRQCLFRSTPLEAGDRPVPIRVPVATADRLQLVVRAEPGHLGPPCAIWAAAVLRKDDSPKPIHATKELKKATVEMYRRQVHADDFTFDRSGLPRPVVVVPQHWVDEIDPTRPPAVETASAGLHALATPGEYEPVSFVVYARDDLPSVEVSVSDLKPTASAAAAIPPANIDVRLVLRRLMRDLYTYPPERSTVVARYLLPNQPVDVPAGTFRQYHLVVRVPETASPGTYRGEVELVCAGKPVADLPLEVEVLPFRLAELRDKGHGIYYAFPPMDGDWSRVEVELADIRAHGAITLKPNLGVQYREVGGQLVPDYGRLRRGLELLKKHGFNGPLPVETGAGTAARLLKFDPVADWKKSDERERFLATIKRAMEGLLSLQREYPQFELLATHMDEVFNRERLPRYIRLTEAVRQVPSLRVYITLHNSLREGTEEMMRACDPYVDVRCYNGHVMDSWIRSGHTFDDLAAELQRSGDEAWLYHNIRGAFFPAEWTRLVNGVYLWVGPLRFHVPWMYYSYKGNPFDATDGPRLRGGDFAYAVPDPDHPARMIPTRHWEAYREGVDDLRYLATLEQSISTHRGTAEAAAAARWLAELRSQLVPRNEELEPIEKESPLLVWWSSKLSGSDYERLRREIARQIIRLEALD